ncbi:MAG: hypothetical protein KKA90_01030 [Nanoarchaeota archaeon]|nr:hypothetical protein [Nanoarchaeota archaeon]
MRGFWHTVEAVLAGSLLITFLIVVSQPVFSDPQPKDQQLLAYELLHDLDLQGVLRNDAFFGNATAINSRIQIGHSNHSVQVCTASVICNGTAPEARNVWIGSYMLAGDDLDQNGEYRPLEVKLYIWE